MESDIEQVISEDVQIDPSFKTERCYLRITAAEVKRRLCMKKNYPIDSFCERTVNNVLNRFGYTLKKVLKTKPLRKIPETDAIFENVASHHACAQKNPKILRISIDTKAKVKVGALSRGGYNRMKKAAVAYDHDQSWETTLIPFGVYELNTDQVTLLFGNSKETSDFIVDALEQWWQIRKDDLIQYDEILIDLDNGKASAGNTKRFLKRMVEFSQSIHKPIQLVYYPPYHSKYNPIERVWAALENYWKGLILDSVPNTLNIARHMVWKGFNPIVQLIDRVYEKGLPAPSLQEIKELEKVIVKHLYLKKWDLKILPEIF